MRVLTMNLHAHHKGWKQRRAVLARGLRDLAPDVAVLQETHVTQGDDQVVDVLGTGYQVHHQPGRTEDGVGASIASRWPFEVVRQVGLPSADDGGPRASIDETWVGSLVIVSVQAPDPVGRVLLAHHKPTWESGAEAVRERQAVASANAIAEVAGDGGHVVLAGDFDATPDAGSIRFWTGRQSLAGSSVHYQDAWEAAHPTEPGHTFTPRNPLVSSAWRPRPGRRIDYVMVRCGDHGGTLDVVSCSLAFGEPVAGVWASDHFGVVADLRPVPPTSEVP